MLLHRAAPVEASAPSTSTKVVVRWFLTSVRASLTDGERGSDTRGVRAEIDGREQAMLVRGKYIVAKMIANAQARGGYRWYAW